MIVPVVFGATRSQSSFFAQLQGAINASTLEHFQAIAERYEDGATLGPGLDRDGGS